MRIEIYCSGFGWHWDLKDSRKRLICTCAPNNGLLTFGSKAACIASIERFEESVFGGHDHFDVVAENQTTGEFEFLW